MKRAHILGVGHYVPGEPIPNTALEEVMDTTDAWIRQRTGIQQRYFIGEQDNCGASDLAYHAALQALEEAGLTAQEIDLIIFATLSPDVDFPGSGVFLQRLLEIPGVPALDIRNQCSGFLYGLSIADSFIRSGQYDHILLVGAEVHSAGLDMTTRGRDLAVLFGDGAGAAVIGPVEDGRGVLSTRLHADGRYAEDLWMEYPSFRTRKRITVEDIEAGRHFAKMNGRKVFKFAVQHLPAVLQEALDASGKTLSDLDLLIPHQANLRINEAVAKYLDLSADKVFNNIQKYGNTTAASIPIALHEARQEGFVKPGDLVAFGAFGSGFTWAAAIVQF